MIAPEKISSVFQAIESDGTARKYFFYKLSTAEIPFEWFDELERRGYFNPLNMPEPTKNEEGDTIVEQWEVVGFLINCTLKNKILNEEIYWERIVQISHEAINHITDNHLENYKTDFALVELIFNLPFSKIKLEWINYIDYCLNTNGDNSFLSYKLTHGLEIILLSEQVNANTLLLELTKLLLQPSKKMNEDRYSNHNSRIDSYAIEQFFQKYAGQLSEILKEDGTEICETIINEIINSDETSFSVYLIPQISLTYSDENYFELEQLLVSFWSQCLLISPANLVRDKLKLYLKRDHQIFQRVAVFIIGKRFDELDDLFFDLDENPLDNYYIKYETFMLLNQNSSLIKQSDIQRLVYWIENQKFEYLKKNEFDDEELNNYKININKEWLFALLETKNSTIVEMYNKYFELNSTTLSHPGHTFWMDYDEGVVNGDNSLNFTTLKISEVIDQLNSFISTGEIRGRLDRIDFSNSLREDVSTNPEKYLTDITALLELNPTFQYSLLIGLLGVAQNRENFPWEEVLLYIDTLLKSLDELPVSGNNTRNLESVLSAALNIMELALGPRNISTENAQAVNKILTYFLLSERHFSSPDITDKIFSMYNSIDFKMYSIWFLWFLQSHHLNLWSDESEKEAVKLKISQYFENCRNCNAFHFSFGRYLPNFFSKEPAFVEFLIAKFDGYSDEGWIDLMKGYLFFGSNLYSGTYELLKRHGLYTKALNYSFEDDTVENRKITHISLAFLEGKEPLSSDDSLMKSILDSNNSLYFEEVIKFIVRKQNLHLVEEHFDNFRELFLTLTQKVKLYEDVELKYKHLGLLGGWIILFHDLDKESFECFKTTAQYLHFQHKTTTFLNHLITFATTKPDETSKLLKIALQSDSRNTFYHIEKMLDLIDALRVSLESDILIPICNIFITKGYTQFSKKVQELNRLSDEAN